MYLLINDVVLVALTGIDTGVAIALIYRPGVSDPYPPIPPVSVPSGYPNATDFPELGYPYVSSNNATVSGSEELAYVTDSASARVWVSCGATYNNGTTLTPTALAPNTPIKWTDPNSSLYGSVTTPSTATVGFVYTGGVVYTWSDFLIFLAYDATNQKFRYMVWDYSTSAWFAASDLYAPTAPTNYATRDQTVYGGAANEALYDASGYPVFFQTWTPAAGTTSISTVKIRSVFWRPTIVGGLPYGTMLQQENTVTVTPTNVTAGSSWACKITTQGLRKGYGGWAAVGGNGNASAPTTIYYGQIIAQIDYGWSATQTFSPVTSFALSGNAWTALMFTAAWSFTGSTPARTDSSGRIYQVRTDPALISRWQMVRTSPNGAVETWNFLEGTIQLSSVGAEGYLNFTTANAIYNGDFVVATSGVVYIPVVKMLTGWVASFYEATEITANATKRYKHQVEILAVSGTTVDTVWTSPVRAFARTASSTSLLSNILAWYQISQGLGTAPNMGTSGGGYGKYLFIRAGNSQRNTYLRFITAELPVNGDGDLIAASTFNSPTTDNFNTINIA
jgi:hypothetical protein